MANFTNNRYPWPTEDHGGANAQTGGNTRLLFAEQDNYRTRKGFAGGETAAVAQANYTDAVLGSSDIAAANAGYLGAHASDTDANTAAADATGTDGDFYYNTADNQFKSWRTSDTWAVITSRSSGIELISGGDISFFLASSSNHAHANENALVDYLVDNFTDPHNEIRQTTYSIVYLTDLDKIIRIISFYGEVAASVTLTDVVASNAGFLGILADDAAATSAAAGATAVQGDWYYNSTTDKYRFWEIDGTPAWTSYNAFTAADARYNGNQINFAFISEHYFANENRLAHFGLIRDGFSAYTSGVMHVIAYLKSENKVVDVDDYTAGTAATEVVVGSGANDVFYVIPRVVSADIAETTENIPIEFLKGSLSANKAQAGAQTYGNGFSIAASEEGMHLFLRTLCNSRNDDIIVKTRYDDSDATPKRDTLADAVVHVDGGGVATISTDAESFAIDIVVPAVVQLIVDPTGIGADNVLELQIDGYDHEGEELREIMLLTAADNSTAKVTDFYFAQPPEGETTTYTANTAGGTSAAISITSVDRWTEVTFNQQDSVLLPGWTVEVRKGTIPFTYVGVSPNEASIALSRDTALQMDITTIAFDSLPYTDIEGNRVNLDDGKGSEGVDIDGEQGRGQIDFVDASETLFTGWQAYLDVTEPGTATPVRVPLTDATFSINHQLDQAQLIVGDRRPGPPFRSTLRDVMLDGTILFTRERDWVRLFRNNTDFKNPVVVLRNAPAGGFPYELHIELGLGQLMSSPDPQVSDLGLITQAFNMKFRETMSGMSDDFRFKIVTDKWIFETEDDTVGGLRIDGIYAEPTA